MLQGRSRISVLGGGIGDLAAPKDSVRYSLLKEAEGLEHLEPSFHEGLEQEQQPMLLGEPELPEIHAPPHPNFRQVLLQNLESRCYQCLTAIICMLNALVIGCETDHPNHAWDYLESVFLFYFTVELILRVVANTPQYYYSMKNPDCLWNIFDCMIVTVGLLDFIWTFCRPNGSQSGSICLATVFRVVRLSRVLRILKIIRFLKQLYLLAYGFVEAVVAVFWVTILMTFVLYVCGIVLARTYGRLPEEDPYHQFLNERFGTVPGSMLTLFELMSQPDLHAYQDVVQSHPSMLPFLVTFIIFGSFGMIALLTGVISESMFEKNKARIQEELQERERKRAMFQRECGQLFATMSSDENGQITQEELLRRAGDVMNLIAGVGVSLSALELQQLFTAIDFDASGKVDKEEFEQGLVQMCEDLRPISIMQLSYYAQRCFMSMESCNERVDRKFSEMEGKMEEFSKILSSMKERKMPALPSTPSTSTPLQTIQQRGGGSRRSSLERVLESPDRTLQDLYKLRGGRGSEEMMSGSKSDNLSFCSSSQAQSSHMLHASSSPRFQDLATGSTDYTRFRTAVSRDDVVNMPSDEVHHVERDRSFSGGANQITSPMSSLSVCSSAAATLTEFRQRLEDLAMRVKMEMHQADAASRKMEELLAVTAREATMDKALHTPFMRLESPLPPTPPSPLSWHDPCWS